MRIKDIMSSKVEFVSPDSSLYAVLKKIQTGEHGYVVVTKDNQLMGVVTERDIAIRCLSEIPLSPYATAAHIMVSEVLYCQEMDGAKETAISMTKNKVRRLMVLNNNKELVGVVMLGELASPAPLGRL